MKNHLPGYSDWRLKSNGTRWSFYNILSIEWRKITEGVYLPAYGERFPMVGENSHSTEAEERCGEKETLFESLYLDGMLLCQQRSI